MMVYVSIGIIIMMILVSLWTNSRFRDHDRLPMQWSLTGKVTWTAPRKLALSFFPGLATVMLVVFSVMAAEVAPRPGQEALAPYVAPFMVTLLLMIQCGHLLVMWRTLRSGER